MTRRIAIVFGSIISVTLSAQSRPSVTAADYARANKFLAPALNGLVVGGVVAPTWLPDERFWYRNTLADGTVQTILVSPAARTRVVCTDAVAECRGLTDQAATGAGRAGGRGGG